MLNRVMSLSLVGLFIIVASYASSQVMMPGERCLSERGAALQNVILTPLAFTQNNGQWPDSILFRAGASGAAIWFSKDAVYHQFSLQCSEDNSKGNTSGSRFKNANCRIEMIKTVFVGANDDQQIAGLEKMEYKCNYLIGNDRSKWVTDVPNYQAILLKEIYPGIDLKYYGDARQIEYDFVASPGADYTKICMKYEGAESISIDELGRLAIQTKFGRILERAPLVYQEINGERRTIHGEFRQVSDNVFGFELDDSYNPSLAVVIDPILEYSTYFGGASDDDFTDVAQGNGYAYMTGLTVSADFPLMAPYDATYNGADDIFVTKISPAGNNMIYSTYIGGASNDVANAIAVDGYGCAYITGWTTSADYPTYNAYDATYGGGGRRDAFVSKLTEKGNGFYFSTYLGGALSNDEGMGIDVGFCDTMPADSRDSSRFSVYYACVVGRTDSTGFPILNAYDASFNGAQDVFVTKFTTSGTGLVFSTYMGGTDHDISFGIAVNYDCYIYITGETYSTNFPTYYAFDASYNGNQDGFVSKFSSLGALMYSTYYGGAGVDHGDDIDADSNGCAYITGYTSSTEATFPVVNAYDGILGGTLDGFVAKISNGGTSLIYSTYLGGSSVDEGFDIAIFDEDIGGLHKVAVTGSTFSSDFPTKFPNDADYNGVQDAFLTILTSAGNSLSSSTYFGGSLIDIGYGLAIDDDNNIIIGGMTNSTDIPLKNALDDSPNGAHDVFLAKFSTIFICGDATHNGVVNALDVTCIINYLYKHGPEPIPLEAADVNDSGTINALDITYMINFLYKSGRPPHCP